MKQDFKFVNIAWGKYSELVDVIRTTVVSDYQPATEGKKMSMIQPSPSFWGMTLLNYGWKTQEKEKMV